MRTYPDKQYKLHHRHSDFSMRIDQEIIDGLTDLFPNFFPRYIHELTNVFRKFHRRIIYQSRNTTIETFGYCGLH